MDLQSRSLLFWRVPHKIIFFFVLVESLGTGIVRGIDATARILYVATTADPAMLDHVNCLLAGATALPESVQLTAASAGKRRSSLRNDPFAVSPPYVTVGPTDPLDLPWQRSHQYGKHSS